MNVDGNATISTAEHVSQNDPADLSESNSNVNVFLKAFVKAFVKAFAKAFIASSRQNICRWRDPKCNFDFIPKRSNNNSMDSQRCNMCCCYSAGLLFQTGSFRYNCEKILKTFQDN